MARFVPAKPGTISFYGGQPCSESAPAETDNEVIIAKARNNPDFSEVIVREQIEVFVAPKKKASKKKAKKKVSKK